jgi:hypothetical protein
MFANFEPVRIVCVMEHRYPENQPVEGSQSARKSVSSMFIARELRGRPWGAYGALVRNTVKWRP